MPRLRAIQYNGVSVCIDRLYGTVYMTLRVISLATFDVLDRSFEVTSQSMFFMHYLIRQKFFLT